MATQLAAERLDTQHDWLLCGRQSSHDTDMFAAGCQMCPELELVQYEVGFDMSS